ncbi:protein prune homolog 2-like [Drosophila sulfurigaster albostrigata]|uniref:protein prune homolog 2-like n=1 Tax=Drosophila sulfurigaster albostrigata TaxID=89887 RepID=UPI002D21E5E2|nr:protein prune homolog 2-like [Drosophila sulfurigaster albostrigata]
MFASQSQKVMDFMEFLANSQRLTQWRPTGRAELMYITLSHECCDLDSVVCTLAVAYLHYRNPGTLKHNYMPVLNMLRRDFPSKSEVRFLLEQQQITADHHLVFRDDVPEELLLRSRYILVNHHVSPFHYCTEEVYDYRPYQCEAARLPIYCQRVMHPMHSCAALIVERYDSAIYNYANIQCPRVYELLHAALLLQNNNFAQYSSEKQLEEVRDYQLMLYLEKKLGVLQAPQRSILYGALVAAMFDLNELTLPQILRREFKLLRANNGSHLVRIAQCCFPMAVTRFISFEFAQLALQQFGSEHNCDFILLLGTSMRPKGALAVKELALIPLDALRNLQDRRFFDHLIVNLNDAEQPFLGLDPYRGLHFMQGAFFFLKAWNIQFYDMLHLVQRIIYHWVSEYLYPCK